MLAANDTRPIMFELKEATQTLHDATEEGDFNKQLVQGALPLERYVESLAQLFLVHQRLESHFRRLRSTHPALAAVVRDYQFQEPYLLKDLEYFGRSPADIRPLPATSAFLERIEHYAAHSPMALLGAHYVFEGSNNGSKFISRAIRKAYSLTDLNGTHYLDPYGESQRAYWQAFKDDMNAQDFTTEERRATIAAARETFEAVTRIHRELSTSASTTPVPGPSGACPFHR